MVSKNRWTASRATILAVAARNGGVFAAGGSGTLRLLDGIQTGVRDVEIDRMITRIEIDSSFVGDYCNATEHVYLGCGADGVARVEFGHSEDLEKSSTETRSSFPGSLLAGQYSDLHFFGG